MRIQMKPGQRNKEGGRGRVQGEAGQWWEWRVTRGGLAGVDLNHPGFKEQVKSLLAFWGQRHPLLIG